MHLHPLPAFTDNYIWLLHNGRQALVVDPGQAAPVKEALAALGLHLQSIVVTHHHGDHVGGVAMNGTKNLVSALLTAIAVAIYAAGGVVQWKQALIMMVAATLGGYLGARVARKIPPHWLRGGIVVTGLVMAGLFF